MKNTVLTITKKEIIDTIRDGRFQWSAGIITLVLFSTLLYGWSVSKRESTERAAAAKAERARWISQDEKNPHSAAHYGVYAFKPKSLLSGVDKGTDAFTGTVVYLEAHVQNQFQYRAAAEATSLQRFGDLTAAYALQLLIPLLIVLLTYSAFSGERESGTLRQVLSLGVSKVQLALGKFLGTYTLILILTLPPTLIGIVISDGASLQTISLSRLGILLGLYLIYFLILTSIGLSVSAFSKSSRIALSILLAFWFIQGFILPRVATDFGATLYPTSTVKTFEAKVKDDIVNGIDGHNPFGEQAKKIEKEVLQKYGVDSTHKLPVNLDAILMQAGEDHTNDVYDIHFGNLIQTMKSQAGVFQTAAFASPTLGIQNLSMGMAGTDIYHHYHFLGEAESYRRLFNRMLNADMERNSKTGDWEYKAGKDLWEKVPEFTYQSPSATWALSNLQTALSALLFWGMISIGMLAASIQKLKPE